MSVVNASHETFVKGGEFSMLKLTGFITILGIEFYVEESEQLKLKDFFRMSEPEKILCVGEGLLEDKGFYGFGLPICSNISFNTFLSLALKSLKRGVYNESYNHRIIELLNELVDAYD